jgi:hypothetical protein
MSRIYSAPKIEFVDQYHDEGLFLALVDAAQHGTSLVVERVYYYIWRQSVWLLNEPYTKHDLILTKGNNAMK